MFKGAIENALSIISEGFDLGNPLPLEAQILAYQRYIIF